MYAEKFNLDRCIRFNRKVVNLTYADDYDSSGRWKVTVVNVENEDEREEEVFDGVMIATGHHVIPLLPTYPGQESFKGKILHTHDYKHADGYAGQSVAVVGIGNSGADTIAELALSTKVVYLATRRGCWIRSRVSAKGWPIDNYFATRAFRFVTSLLPKNWVDSAVEGYLNLYMDHELYGLKPKHRVSQQHPTINDAMANAVIAGRIAVRPNIKEFTENGIIFEGSNQVTPVDTVIFATGYKLELPFVDKSIIAPSNNEVFLYKNMFSCDLRHSHTLALIGLVQPLGPIHVTAELQARYFASLMTGKNKLPSRDEMKRITSEDKKYIQSIFYSSPRHHHEIDFVKYCDEMAEFIGCKPNMWKIALTDPQLWYHLWFGLFTVYQYRLTGPHAWPKARETIIHTNDRIRSALNMKYPRLAEEAQVVPQTNGYYSH